MPFTQAEFDKLNAAIQNAMDEVDLDEGPRIEALPRNGGWQVYDHSKGKTIGTLHKSHGWTQSLVDEMVRLVTEGLPL